MIGKQDATFAVVTKNGEVLKVGRSCVECPEIKYSGKPMKWFNDNLLLKSRK